MRIEPPRHERVIGRVEIRGGVGGLDGKLGSAGTGTGTGTES